MHCTHLAGTVIVDNWKADGVARLFVCLLARLRSHVLRLFGFIGEILSAHCHGRAATWWMKIDWGDLALHGDCAFDWKIACRHIFLCEKWQTTFTTKLFYSCRNVMNQLAFDFISFQSMKLLSCTIVLTSIPDLISIRAINTIAIIHYFTPFVGWITFRNIF